MKLFGVEVEGTAGGRAAYFLGLAATLFGASLEHRGIVVFGAGLLLPCLFTRGLCVYQARGLRGRVERPDVARARVDSPVRVRLHAGAPIFGLRVVEERARGQHGFEAAVGWIARGGRHEIHGLERHPRRGLRRPPPLQALIDRPLALAEARRRLDSRAEPVLVLPALGRVRGALKRLLAGRVRSAPQRSRRRGPSLEIHALRPYVRGDSRRRIHWRASARAGELLVREGEEERDGRLWVGLEVPHADSPEASHLDLSISLLATLIDQAFREERPLRVAIGDREVVRIGPGDRRARHEVERTLALLEAEGTAPDPTTALGEPVALLVSGGPRKAVPGGPVVLVAPELARNGQFVGFGGAA